MADSTAEFEARRPPEPLPYSAVRESIWQFLATLVLVVGAWYIWWRWNHSLNADAMWFAVPLVMAETFSYFGLILYVFNLWKDQKPELPVVPKLLRDVDPTNPDGDRKIAVDVMFATYNEDPDLVRLGLIDAKNMTYPYPIDIRIHVLDDGRRPEMKAVCDQEGVMEAALRSFAANVERRAIEVEEEYTIATKERTIAPQLMDAIRTDAATAEVLTPYRFHVPEDIYTSIVLHSDRERGWKSIMHPFVESKMLSPQDLLTWTIQRFKYAGGSLDIMVNDNPIFRRGLTLGQRMMYGMTFYSYLAPLWNIIFLFSPIVYLFSGIAPVDAYSSTFFLLIIPFLVTLELAMMVGAWGVAGYASKASYLSFFPVGLKAIWTVARGKKISFHVTPKVRQPGNFLTLVRPQLAILIPTALGAVWGIGALVIGGTTHNAAGVVTNIL